MEADQRRRRAAAERTIVVIFLFFLCIQEQLKVDFRFLGRVVDICCPRCTAGVPKALRRGKKWRSKCVDSGKVIDREQLR